MNTNGLPLYWSLRLNFLIVDHLGSSEKRLWRFLDMEGLWLNVFEWILGFSRVKKISTNLQGLCAKYGGHFP